MKKASEKTLEKRLYEEIRKRKGYALKMHTNTVSGLPDRLVLLPGAKACFVEVKSEGKVPEPHQKAVRKILEKMDFEVWTIDSNKILMDFLNSRK